jgi:putative nucleotidyltransferase with HDIG domain
MPLSLGPETQKLLQSVYRFSKNKKVKLYLVGGYPRDLLLKRKKNNPDLDFCLKNNAVNFGRHLARELKAGLVVLDKEHGCCRLVKKIKDKFYTLDFSDWRGPTLKDDLLHRDFTINTLAVALEDILTGKWHDDFWIDFYGARKDLKSRLIRLVNSRAFDEDPLRILRAFSLAAIFGFKIEPEALRLAKAKAKKLKTVSWERIRDELFKVLETSNSWGSLLEMDKLGVLKFIIPEIELMRGVNQGPYHHLDVLKHSLETVRQFEMLLGELKHRREINAYLNETISAERMRYSLIKLGALLHDIGKPQAKRRLGRKTIFHGHERIGSHISEEVCWRLRLSNDEWRALQKMVFWHLRPGYLGDNEELSRRAIFRYLRDTAGEAVSVLLISLADQRATRGPLTTKASRVQHEKTCHQLIAEYFKKKKEKRPVRLITGDDLIREFKLAPSPLIGKVLAELEELQAIGKIQTRKEALKAAQKYLQG